MERKNGFEYPSDLIFKYLTNSLSQEEVKEFELWYNESATNRDLVESFKDTEKIQSGINYIHNVDLDSAWANINHQLVAKPVQLFSFKNIIRYGAAVLVVAFGLFTYWYVNESKQAFSDNVITAVIPAGTQIANFQLSSGEVINLNSSDLDLKSSAVKVKNGTLFFKKTANTPGDNILKTPKAGEYQMVLPDGTHVWLNASSTLSFANSFNKNERKVYLNGEAYFEVAHQKMPFVVSFNNTEVEVLGTHFNINTYSNESKTTLLEGAIRITEGSNQKLLKPGEEATVTAQGIAVAQVETYKSIAWKEGLFLFEEEKIVDILTEVARWYDVQIKYEGKPSDKKYSGNIRRQANLNQVLEMLTAVSGNKFTLTNKTITVKF